MQAIESEAKRQVEVIESGKILEQETRSFDKNTLNLKGWKTKDSYSNNVSFIINNLKINNQIADSFFKIQKEEDL